MNRFKHFSILASAALFCSACLLFAGCGASSSNTYDAAPPAQSVPATAEAVEETTAGKAAPAKGEIAEKGDGTANSPTLTQPADNRKIILTANIDMESLEFDDTCTTLQTEVEKSKGYISSTNISGTVGHRQASFTIKVPAQSYTSFLTATTAAGTVLSREESSEDVTRQFVDVEARITALKTQEGRLLALLQESASLQALMDVQDKLTEVQYEIETYTAQKQTLENLVSYSTVTINLAEVGKVSDAPSTYTETYASKAGRMFKDSWASAGRFFQNISLLLIASLPFILFVALVLVVIFIIVKRVRKNRPKKQAACMPPAAPFAPPTQPMPPTQQAAPPAPPLPPVKK